MFKPWNYFIGIKQSTAIISSGSGSLVYTDVKEVHLLRDQMIRIGIPADKLIAENQSRNTYENAKEYRDYSKSDLPPFISDICISYMKVNVIRFSKQGIDVIPFGS